MLHFESRTPTNEIRCKKCKRVIRYYLYSGMGDVAPHFYCDSCSNVFFRESDNHLLHTQGPTESLLNQLAASLPECPCGGRFRPGMNPKCPHCKFELVHQATAVDRLSDPYAIQLENSSLVIDS